MERSNGVRTVDIALLEIPSRSDRKFGPMKECPSSQEKAELVSGPPVHYEATNEEGEQRNAPQTPKSEGDRCHGKKSVGGTASRFRCLGFHMEWMIASNALTQALFNGICVVGRHRGERRMDILPTIRE